MGAIQAFLSRLDDRISADPGRLPFDANVGRLVLGWAMGHVRREENAAPDLLTTLKELRAHYALQIGRVDTLCERADAVIAAAATGEPI